MSVEIKVAHSEGECSIAWVLLKVDGREFWFQREIGSAPDRVAVVEYLKKALADHIHAVRSVEYERGYKHGRHKRAKIPTYASTLHIADWMKG